MKLAFAPTSVRMLFSISGLFLLAMTGLTVGCGGDAADQSYPATIEEGRAAAQGMLEQTGTASISLAFVADGRLVWAETFGLADKETSTPPTTETMYGIGSVSKMLATVAAMKLVDQGLVDLDEPVTTYVPTFSMLSPEYTQITVRMLLNHTSGFPGTDYRNSCTSNPYLGHAQQVQTSLSREYLKCDPGFMATYCNDGFTMTENIVLAVTGRTFAEFVREEVFIPLGMDHSRYPLEAFQPGSYARTYNDDHGDTFNFMNAHASGGLYSTPSDMARLALMLLENGTLDGVRVLSPLSVQAMAADQTTGLFDPVQCENTRYGLGWDSVSQPGLKAVRVKGWSKGGDIDYYGTAFLLAPNDGLAAVVVGTEGLGSTKATIIAERIVLRALVERGAIEQFPTPLPADPRPGRKATLEELTMICGFHGTSGAIYRIVADENGILALGQLNGTSWTPRLSGLTMRDNGRFSSDEDPLTEISSIQAQDRTYLVLRKTYGFGHYQDESLLAQKLAPTGHLSDAWLTRLGRTWLLVNQRPDALPPSDDLRFSIHQVPGLEGLLAARTHEGNFFILDPSTSDTLAKMMLLLPQAGRDLNDLFVEPRDGGEWMRFGSYLYRPLETEALP